MPQPTQMLVTNSPGREYPPKAQRQGNRVWRPCPRLIHKVYDVDPLECPKCKGPMRVIALIDDRAVIRKILSHLGLWVPRTASGRGPGRPAPDPPRQAAPILTYHPYMDSSLATRGNSAT